MPLGYLFNENQPKSGATPIVALRSKLKQIKDRLLFLKTESLSPLPDWLWNEELLRDLSALVHAVYMTYHKREGITPGRELLWVDGKYKSLRLFKTIGDMIATVPLRPFAAIKEELGEINPFFRRGSFSPKLHNNEAIARHYALEESNQRYRALIAFSAALGSYNESITHVPVDEFKEILREVCPDVLHQLEKGFELHKGEQVERLILRTLFLDFQRQEMAWEIGYRKPMTVMTEWILEFHEERLIKLLPYVLVYEPETPEEYLLRRNRMAANKRVADHRSKRSKRSSSSE